MAKRSRSRADFLWRAGVLRTFSNPIDLSFLKDIPYAGAILPWLQFADLRTEVVGPRDQTDYASRSVAKWRCGSSPSSTLTMEPAFLSSS